LILPLKKASKEKSSANKESATKLYQQLLKETKSIDGKSSWSKLKVTLEKDKRYQTKALTDQEKENLFREYVSKFDDAEKRRHDAIKEREKKVREMRETEERERRQSIRSQDEQQNTTQFKTMLREKIRDPEASWTKSRKILETDPRWNISLHTDEKEKIFRQHCKDLAVEYQNNFKTLLREQSETGKITLATKKFEEIKEFIKEDPRYERLFSDERRKSFDEFLSELKKEIIDQFKELLKESKNIGMITSKTPKSGPQYDHINELLRNDKRYKRLNPMVKERDQAFAEFIDAIK